MRLYHARGKDRATLASITSSIRSLDGERHTEELFTDKTGEILLHVAGGGGNYLVSLTWPDRVLNLSGPDSDELVRFVAADQEVELPRRQVADLTTALQAALHFARTGEPSPALQWYQT